MASKAVASIDQWLVLAEQVLLDQHEQALSPSSSGEWEDVRHEWTVSLASLGLGLGSLLDRLCSRPGRWILIAEDVRRSYRFWQALAFEDGSLVVETASGSGCPDSERLSPEAEGLLVELGWDVPDPPSSPNWRRIEATTSPDVAGVAAQAMRTFHEVFELADKDKVLLALFPSPRRGGTPASECLTGDDASLEEAAPRKGFRPTTEAWADYYRQLFPRYADPRNIVEVWGTPRRPLPSRGVLGSARGLTQRMGVGERRSPRRVAELLPTCGTAPRRDCEGGVPGMHLDRWRRGRPRAASCSPTALTGSR